MVTSSDPERKTPILQFSVLCDGIAAPQEMPGKPVFVGVFSNLLRPTTIPQFFIANRWINGFGEHTQSISILDPELREVVRMKEESFSLSSEAHAHDMYTAFINTNFPKAGVYWVKIELNGQLALSYPLPVFEGK